MNRYTIEHYETLRCTITVDAENEEDAIDTADIVLDNERIDMETWSTSTKVVKIEEDIEPENE